MLKHILTLLILIPIFIFSQNRDGDRTLLQYMKAEAFLVGYSTQIQIVDIDNDSESEIEILFKDTLSIIDDNMVVKYFAYSQPSSFQAEHWILLSKFDSYGMPKLYMISDDIVLPQWSSFEPITNNWNYGIFSEPSYQHGTMYSMDPMGNIWASFFEDNKNWIVKMDELTSPIDTVTYVGEGDPLFQFAGNDFIGYTPIYISRSGQYISTVQSGNNIFTSGNPNGLYYYYSSDFGTTWQGKDIARGSYANPVFGQVKNRNLAPFFTGITTYSGVIDDNGILHLAIYGYGLTPEGNDTIRTTSILYWNSRDENWIAITDPRYESNKDAVGNLLEQYAPGNARGQSIPSISITPDGSIVLVSWTSQEYEGEPGTSAYNIYPGDGGQYSTPVYYTDVLANISYDGGISWSENNIFPLEDEKSATENCAALYPYILNNESNSLTANYIYVADSIPGWWGFFQNSETDNKCFYNSYSLSITGNNSEVASIFEFKLEQNYPNPFNPTTKISWEIPSTDRATIKIFNILGEEITTLIDKVMPAGKYESVFNGRGLASGVYFYQLRSGNYVKTKKMMLLR